MTTEEENPIICLNYCVYDEETGYCLTCGRPPIPVTPWVPNIAPAAPPLDENASKDAE